MHQRLVPIALAGLLVVSGCGKKKGSDAPPVGWHKMDDAWPGECYFPKAYDTLGVGDRKLARADALKNMMTQWKGERDESIKLGTGDNIEFFETVLLGEPELVEKISQQNAAFCKQYMEADEETRSLSAWKKWFKDEPMRLTEGDCPHAPLVDTVFQYLDIGTGWQFKWGVCQDDVVTIKGTIVDRYKITKDGEYIDVNGNGVKTTTEEWPCNIEGCTEGMLIMRFTGDSGVQQIVPIGAEKKGWVAPEHGQIEVQINDTTWFDNEFRQQGQLIDHTNITYVGGGG